MTDLNFNAICRQQSHCTCITRQTGVPRCCMHWHLWCYHLCCSVHLSKERRFIPSFTCKPTPCVLRLRGFQRKGVIGETSELQQTWAFKVTCVNVFNSITCEGLILEHENEQQVLSCQLVSTRQSLMGQINGRKLKLQWRMNEFHWSKQCLDITLNASGLVRNRQCINCYLCRPHSVSVAGADKVE